MSLRRRSGQTAAAIPDNSFAVGATDVFVGYRELLFSIVYNLLGSVADTEDVLQDTWVSWARRTRNGNCDVANPRAYLVRVAVNQALAHRATLAPQREVCVGQWLPTPLVTDADPNLVDAADLVQRTESVSMALLVVLETLSPLERAVFVLHEVFGYAQTEIAAILDRSPAAIRQLACRAREHVRARRPRYHVAPGVQQRLTERFITAQLGGDLNALMELLAPDVTPWADGGKARVVSYRVHGRDKQNISYGPLSDFLVAGQGRGQLEGR